MRKGKITKFEKRSANTALHFMVRGQQMERKATRICWSVVSRVGLVLSLLHTAARQAQFAAKWSHLPTTCCPEAPGMSTGSAIMLPYDSAVVFSSSGRGLPGAHAVKFNGDMSLHSNCVVPFMLRRPIHTDALQIGPLPVQSGIVLPLDASLH